MPQPGEGQSQVVAHVRIEPAAAVEPQLAQLTLLGWYLPVLMADDAVVMTGAV